MSHRSLCKWGYILLKKELTSEAIKFIMDSLILKPIIHAAYTDVTPARSFKIYLEDEERYFVPRWWAEQYFGPPLTTQFSKVVSFPPIICPPFEPRPYQVGAWAALTKQYQADRLGGGTLLLPCGYGKTVLALQTAWRLRVKTLIVVHKEFLLDQWYEEIHRWWPDQVVGRIQGDKWDVKDSHYFVIAMMQTVAKGRYPISDFAQFGFSIVDEVHQIGSEAFSQALPYIFTRYTLGLSATPNRSDGCSVAFYYHLGPLFHSEKRLPSQQVEVYQPKFTGVWTEKGLDPAYITLYRENAGRKVKNTQLMTQKLSECQPRNQYLANVIVALSKIEGRQIIVFSQFREHLQELEKIIRAFPEGPTCGFYWGWDGGKSKALHKSDLAEASRAQVVFSTKMLGSHGLNIPTLNTLVFASPPGNDIDTIDQMCGRIMRRPDAPIKPIIYDPIDEAGNFSAHANDRLGYYKEMEYTVVKT